MESAIPNLHEVVDVLDLDRTQYLPWLDDYLDTSQLMDTDIPLGLSKVLWPSWSSPWIIGVEMDLSGRLWQSRGTRWAPMVREVSR